MSAASESSGGGGGARAERERGTGQGAYPRPARAPVLSQDPPLSLLPHPRPGKPRLDICTNTQPSTCQGASSEEGTVEELTFECQGAKMTMRVTQDAQTKLAT